MKLTEYCKIKIFLSIFIQQHRWCHTLIFVKSYCVAVKPFSLQSPASLFHITRAWTKYRSRKKKSQFYAMKMSVSHPFVHLRKPKRILLAWDSLIDGFWWELRWGVQHLAVSPVRTFPGAYPYISPTEHALYDCLGFLFSLCHCRVFTV